jgi:hypothetical protein
VIFEFARRDDGNGGGYAGTPPLWGRGGRRQTVIFEFARRDDGNGGNGRRFEAKNAFFLK